MTPHRGSHLAALLLIAGVLVGCSGTRPYAPTADNNVRFTTVAESGSWLSSVRASVHIHSVNENCHTDYQGTIALGRSAVLSGLPAGRASYLIFTFDSSSFLANSRSSISYKTLLTPRRGHDYVVAVRYVDDTYNATIREVNRRSQTRRQIAYKPLDACRARSWKIRGK